MEGRRHTMLTIFAHSRKDKKTWTWKGNNSKSCKSDMELQEGKYLKRIAELGLFLVHINTCNFDTLGLRFHIQIKLLITKDFMKPLTRLNKIFLHCCWQSILSYGLSHQNVCPYLLSTVSENDQFLPFGLQVAETSLPFIFYSSALWN